MLFVRLVFEIKKKPMKCLYKCEVAERAGVSVRTLTRWMKRHYDHLVTLGYRPQDKYLQPRVLQWLATEYCIDL